MEFVKSRVSLAVILKRLALEAPVIFGRLLRSEASHRLDLSKPKLGCGVHCVGLAGWDVENREGWQQNWSGVWLAN